MKKGKQKKREYKENGTDKKGRVLGRRENLRRKGE